MDRSGRHWILLGGVWLLYFAFGLNAVSLAPLASIIIEDLRMTHTQMGLVMGAWQLVFIVSAIPAGILLDRLGPRIALTIGGSFVFASALLRTFADSGISMILAVMVFGIGGPIISTGAPKVVIANFAGSARGLAMGIYMTGPSIGAIVALTTTHGFFLPLLDQDWRHLLLIWAGIALLATLIWPLIGAHSLSPEAESNPTPQIRVIQELITKPTVILLLLMSVCVFMFNHGLNNWLPEILHSKGMDRVAAGFWAALPTVVGIIGSLIIPRFATPERRFHILLGLSIAAVAASVFLQFTDTLPLALGLFLQGVARSSLMTVMILTLVELPDIGERRAGVASGLFFSAAEVGGVLGPLMLGYLYAPGLGFSIGLWLMFAVSAALAVGASLLRIQYLRQQPAKV